MRAKISNLLKSVEEEIERKKTTMVNLKFEPNTSPMVAIVQIVRMQEQVTALMRFKQELQKLLEV